ncbi:unnamed protein product [Acidithrix sp. C25]|nr:unnamed protein product [Acidithrix sp. C25]
MSHKKGEGELRSYFDLRKVNGQISLPRISRLSLLIARNRIV